jgi:hypothetical protein
MTTIRILLRIVYFFSAIKAHKIRICLDVAHHFLGSEHTTKCGNRRVKLSLVDNISYIIFHRMAVRSCYTGCDGTHGIT